MPLNEDQLDILKAVEGFLANKADHGDQLAGSLRRQLLSVMKAPKKIAIDLTVFDAEGNSVDGKTSTMTIDQASDIIDHASQAVTLHRAGRATSAVLNELDEALTVAGVLDAAA